MGDWESIKLVNELTKGKELARQLQIHINNINNINNDNNNSNNGNSWSQETCEYLVQKILVSFEKGISMLNWPSSAAATAGDQLLPPPQTGGGGVPMSESPPSRTESPRSDQDSDRDQENRDASKKRKSMPRWTKQVKVNPGMGLEGPLDDGFSWRKYGQKDILGAKYPRGYYRCTHRSIQGCLATKQVQRSNDDPTIFEVTYRGRHTCNRASNTFSRTTTIEATQENPEPILPNKNDTMLLPHNHSSIIIHNQNTTNSNHNIQIKDQQSPLNDQFKSGLKVITQGLENDTHNFYFASASTQLNTNTQNDGRFGLNDNNFVGGGGFSPTSFAAASGTNYFSVAQFEEQLRLNQSFHNPNSESEISSEINNLDFPFGYLDDQLDTKFTFGHPPGYF